MELSIAMAFPPPSLNIPNMRCSVPIKLCPNRSASSLLYAITSLTLGEKLSSICLIFFNLLQKADQLLLLNANRQKNNHISKAGALLFITK